jgi:hypothetical protein
MWRELQLAASASADVRPDQTKAKTSAEARLKTGLNADERRLNRLIRVHLCSSAANILVMR